MNNEERNELYTQLHAYKALAEKLNVENEALNRILNLIKDGEYKLLYKGVGRWVLDGCSISHGYLSNTPDYLVKEGLGNISCIMCHHGNWAAVSVTKEKSKDDN